MPTKASSASRNPRERPSRQRQIKKPCKAEPSSNCVTNNSKAKADTETKSSIGFIRASHLKEVLTALTNWSAKLESKSGAAESISGGATEAEFKIENVSRTTTNAEQKSPVPQRIVVGADDDVRRSTNSTSRESKFVDSNLDRFSPRPGKRTENYCPAGSSKITSVQKGAESHEVPKRMSLLEQKRVQWAAERAQMREWDPWGKPGGGAPSCGGTESRQTMIADSKDWTKANNCNYRLLTSPLQISVGDDFNQQNGRLPPLPQTTSPNINMTIKPVPAALASSLTFGVANVNHNYDSWKEEAKKHWLNELDKQREEQRLKRLEEKGSYQKLSLSNNINAQASLNNLSQNSKVAGVAVFPPDQEHAPTLPTLNKSERILSPSPTSNNMDCGNVNVNDPSIGSQSRTFLRGANIPLDSKTQLELTKKREKALEQQKAIKHQLEERLRLKQQEQERRKKEEFEEEMRLAKEREQLEEQFLHEQQQRALKEETQNQQREAAFEAIHEARKSAKATKERKQFTQLPDVLDGTGLGIIAVEKGIPQAPLVSSSTKNTLNVPLDNSTPYIFNRVLTPTKFRDRNLATRDCSTQTDFPATGHIPYKKDMATITGSSSKGLDSDTSSVGQKNAKSKSRSSRKKASKQVSKKERPQWGVNQVPPRKQLPPPQKPLKPAPQTSPTVTARKAAQPSTTGSRRFSGSKSRSSAEHQHKVIAQERSMALISQRICLSPLPATRSTATDSSTTGDEVANQDQPTRRRRRQWVSPGRDEMPTFYTNSPLLPDVRNIRRVSVSSSSNSSPPKLDPNVPQTSEPSWAPQPFRTDSPPVPALRHKMNLEAFGFQDLQSSAAEPKPISRTLSPAEPQEHVIMRAVVTLPAEAHSFESSEIHTEDLRTRNCHSQAIAGVDPDVNKRSSTPSCPIKERELNSSLSLGSPSLQYQRADILKKLTLIRHGLLLRQQELDSILACQENSLNERQEQETNGKQVS